MFLKTYETDNARHLIRPCHLAPAIARARPNTRANQIARATDRAQKLGALERFLVTSNSDFIISAFILFSYYRPLHVDYNHHLFHIFRSIIQSDVEEQLLH